MQPDHGCIVPEGRSSALDIVSALQPFVQQLAHRVATIRDRQPLPDPREGLIARHGNLGSSRAVHAPALALPAVPVARLPSAIGPKSRLAALAITPFRHLRPSMTLWNRMVLS